MSRRPSYTKYQGPQNAAITAVLGPTNTGKTHLALERMLGHESGMIGLPLRLLAREIYDKIVKQRGAQSVALITGEEKIIPRQPRYYVSTVEAMPLDIPVAFLAVDEIQLCEDPERGHVFTDRLLHCRGTQETMFLGAETIRPLLNQLLPGIKFSSRARFSELSYSGPKKLSRLPRRSAVVSFSSESVYGIAELIRRQRGGAAVVMGALSPRTRNAQVELYQSGDVDYLVATDAIGMGLNMDVDHIAFASLSKFDGRHMRRLRATETAQIAGRAGRYMNDGTFGTTADCPQMGEDIVEQIESHRFDPIRAAFWRNRRLDFSSLRQLIRSLEIPAPQHGLMRSRAVTDVLVLKGLAQDENVSAVVKSTSALKTLWDVCQIPDFRKVMLDEHISLIKNLFEFLIQSTVFIPEDWMAAKLKQLDRTDGDIDTLSNRIAHVRTWTYVTNRSGWLKDTSHWRERTRALEDKLSDALHQSLTKRFVDRRTSVLMKNLRERGDLLAGISDNGEVTVEGEYVGRLSGFQFHADPRAQGIHSKALRNAAARSLQSELMRRGRSLLEASDVELQLHDNGKIWWQEAPIATLSQGKDWLHPQIEGTFGELTDSALIQQIRERLQIWLRAHLIQLLKPLFNAVSLSDGKISDRKYRSMTASVRGLCFQLTENYGILDRSRISGSVKGLTPEDRKMLRLVGVRIGEYALYIPALLKSRASETCLILLKVWHSQPSFSLPGLTNRGLYSLEADTEIEPSYYRAAGFLTLGKRAIRIDMLERLAILLREESYAQTGQRREAIARAKVQDEDYAILAMIGLHNRYLHKAIQRIKSPMGFRVTGAMQSLAGCGGDEFDSLLKTLGYRQEHLKMSRKALRLLDFDSDENSYIWMRRKMPWAKAKPKKGRTTSQPTRRGQTELSDNGKFLALEPRRDQTRHQQDSEGKARQKAKSPKGLKRDRTLSDSPFAILATLQGAK